METMPISPSPSCECKSRTSIHRLRQVPRGPVQMGSAGRHRVTAAQARRSVYEWNGEFYQTVA